MKSTLAVLAALSLPSVAWAPAAQELVFRVAKGTTLTKTFSTALDVEKKSISMSVDGRELPKEIAAKFEMSFALGESFEIQDEYVDVDGARPKELVRTFRKATRTQKSHASAFGSEPKDENSETESPLVDHVVVFTWNAKEKSFEKKLRGEGGDPKWVARLAEDTDLRRILPDGPVDVGEAWKIDPEVFEAISFPDRGMPFQQKKDDQHFDFGKNVTGDIEAKYEGTREVDGQKLGVITVKARVKSHDDASEDEKPSFEVSLDLEGEYLWDIEAKHLFSFELHGPVELSMKMVKEIEAKGQKLELTMNFTLGGEMQSSSISADPGKKLGGRWSVAGEPAPRTT
jgi:hypothetical protein